MAETVLGNGLRDSPAPPAVQLAAELLIAAELDAAAWTVDAADILDQLETRVLGALDPPLNLAKMPRTPVRERLTDLRRRVT